MKQDYHLDELRIALDRNHAAHILPPAMAAGSVILDLGCGAGQTMIAAYPDAITFGLDIDFAGLQLGKSLSSNTRFCCGRMEELPYGNDTFDLIVSRVSLAYTDIGRSLREAQRVLKPNGHLWITLHSWRVPWAAAKRANWRGKLFSVYVLVNSLSLHWFEKQFSVRGRQETFQTGSRMAKLLSKCGFAQIRMKRGRHFLIEARSAKIA